jgi:hypothetical protein
MRIPIQAVVLAVLVISPATQGQTIDFEKVPGIAVPIDGMSISNQFQGIFGVSFSLEGGGFPVLAKVGAPLTAFSGPTGEDGPATNQNAGSFFLTDDGQTGLAPPALIISYGQPVAAASGVIIDIDSNPALGGAERWRVEARNATNVLLESTLLAPNSFNGGDGKATPWSFARTTNDIYFVRVVYAGDKTNGIGLAFDNFSPSLPVEAARLRLTRTGLRSAIELSGSIGGTYRVEYSDLLPASNWLTLSNVVLPQSPFTWFDTTSPNTTNRFYRALGFR